MSPKLRRVIDATPGSSSLSAALAPATPHRQVTPWRAPLPFTGELEQALAALADEPHLCCLTGAWAGGGALIASAPLRVAGPGQDPFELLDDLPAPTVAHHAVPARAEQPDEPWPGAGAGWQRTCAVGGGWFGWLGYRLARRVEDVPLVAARPTPMPEFHLAYYDNLLRRDAEGRWWFELLLSDARAGALEQRFTDIRRRLSATPAVPVPPPARWPAAASTPTPLRLTPESADHHLRAVADCRERIAAGEIFEANICLRFDGEYRGGALALLREALARDRGAGAGGTGLPRYTAAFDTPLGGILSLSPELFLRRHGREVVSGPIKGTAPRSPDSREAAATRARLLGSKKDAAEHVMIVDLMRNDLGRVCEYGSVRAAREPTAEAHPGVWHLVTYVRGLLRDGVGDADLLRATFPPGSVTGAPKVQALRVIAALEPSGREVFTGAVGFSSPLAGLELNVAIRTLELRDGRVWLGVGGAVVADSEPLAELRETLVKARPVAAAVGTSIDVDESRWPRARPDALGGGR